MRNIYDIITEQKAVADVNMASYDLDYTISHLASKRDTYYIEEGADNALQKFIKAVVDFIKKIIESIRNLVKNIIKFFKGPSGNLEKQLNEKIEKANESKENAAPGGGAKDDYEDKVKQAMDQMDEKIKKDKQRAEDAKKRYDDLEKEFEKQRKDYEDSRPKAGIKISDLQGLLDSSTMQVTAKSFGPLEVRLKFVKESIDAYDKAYDKGCEYISNRNKTPNAKALVLDELFPYVDEDESITSVLQDFCNDSDNRDITFYVFKRSKWIYEYITQSHKTADTFKRGGDAIDAELKDIIKRVESGEARKMDNSATDQQYEMLASFAKSLSTVMASIFNYLVQSTMRAYRICAGIACKVTDHYCRVRFTDYTKMPDLD